ncbi:LysR family transcriptional regulator [Halomonas denitrificans]|uniref:LysR family transcriptional regulator n=1 Tax=Halomonas denitrificans TaxID=370769 RepID=UPI001C9A0D77|nr:LysR family transcriptional regulator [Halomonas denitrificans]MBY5970670.1 LysR family transcriptional regulator [Halomonas denitrificans]
MTDQGRRGAPVTLAGDRLPSMRALRALEAVAELGSVSRAATALHLTHGAVSRQIKGLEQQLGVHLLEREGRGVRLTEAGQELADAIGFHLGALARVCSDVSQRGQGRPFVLNCPGSFLARWFIPRLAALKTALPTLELHLSASEEGEGVPPGADGVLRFQRLPDSPDERALIRVLGKERIGPVHSPHYQVASTQGAGRRQPQELLGHPLLHTRSRPSAWSDWCSQQGMSVEGLSMGQGFEHLTYMLEATLVGLGVGISPDYLVEDDVRAGRLLAPWGFVTTEACLTLHLASGAQGPRHPHANDLADWLAAELGRS